MFDIDDVLWLNRPRLKINWSTVLDSATLSLRHDTKTQIGLRKVY